MLRHPKEKIYTVSVAKNRIRVLVNRTTTNPQKNR